MKRFNLFLAVALLIGAMGTQALAGRVGFWKGEGNANDTEGNSDGILINETSFATAAVGQGFQFDGVNDQVRVPDVGAFHLTNLTVAFWFKGTVNDTPDDENLVGRNGFTTGNWGFAVDTTGLGQRQVKFRAIQDTPATTIIGAVIATNAAGYLNHFFHVAGTIQSGGDMKLYINGVEYASQTFAGTLVQNNVDMYFSGNVSLNRYFGGLIDEVQIWDRALTSLEVANLLPEPSTFSLLAVGFGLLLRRWRRAS